MSRKLITIAVSLVLLAVLCIYEQVSVRRITDDALAQTHALMRDIEAGTLDDAIQKAHALDEAWDRQAKGLELLVDHSATDDVRYALSRLIAALEGDDGDAARIYAGELEGSVEHVLERQTVSAENLL